MQKNLIIGAATGYKIAEIRIFLESLKNTGFKGDTVILVSDKIDGQTKNDIEAYGVHLLYVKNSLLNFTKKYAQSRIWKVHYLPHKILFKLLGTGRRKLSRLSSYVKLFHLISGSRYCYYHDYLLSCKHKYKLILITDVRDVAFQADPFAGIEAEKLLNFYEQDNPIKDNFHTRYWVRHGFGEKALDAIADKICICSGTTIGTFDEIMVYLENMILTQARITAGLTGLGGFDQGVHNYLIYNGFFPGATIVKNTAGEIATLGESAPISLNDDNELVNRYQKVVPVVHQFDRRPDLKIKALR